MHLNHIDFAIVQAALRHHIDHDPELADAYERMTTAASFVADQELRDRAEAIYGSDDLEIDDEGVSTSPTAMGGTWVQAWVWVPDEGEE